MKKKNTSLKEEWILYIIECKDKSLYTGISNNLENRVRLHNLGKASRYTRSRRPVKIVYEERCTSKSMALRKELAIKKLKRKEKLSYIEVNENLYT